MKVSIVRVRIGDVEPVARALIVVKEVIWVAVRSLGDRELDPLSGDAFRYPFDVSEVDTDQRDLGVTAPHRITNCVGARRELAHLGGLEGSFVRAGLELELPTALLEPVWDELVEKDKSIIIGGFGMVEKELTAKECCLTLALVHEADNPRVMRLDQFVVQTGVMSRIPANPLPMAIGGVHAHRVELGKPREVEPAQ